MKIKFVLSLIVFLVITNFNLVSQTNWTKYSDNPVKSPGAQPTCIYDNDTIKMWYATAHYGIARIKGAWSLDGINWNDYNDGNPVMELGADGEWDRGWHDTPEVVKDDDGYKMYYYGDTAYIIIWTISTYDSITCAIGLATSQDGINWEKYSENPVITKGDSASFDGRWIESPALYYDSNSSEYFMWYTGMGWNWLTQIGLARSDCGFIWNKYDENPVISEGPSGTYDDMWVSVPAVIKTDDIYEMWYSAFRSVYGWDSLTIAYAVSLNGIYWIKYPENPVYNQYFPPYVHENDSTGAWAPDVVYIPGTNSYMMFYDGASGINMAASPRNVLYSENCNISVSENITIEQGQNTNLLATGGDYYHWLPEESLSNPYIADPVASPDTTTTYTVLIVSDSCITTAQITVTVEEPQQIMSNNTGNIRVYPNPFKDKTVIEFPFEYNNEYILNIYDIYGKAVRTITGINTGQIIIYKKTLTSGIYFFMLNNYDKCIASGKLIID